MKILISGHTGQVARELQLALHEHELISLGRQAFDLSRPDSLRETILRERPALVINAAAYTAVDQAEQERAGLRHQCRGARHHGRCLFRAGHPADPLLHRLRLRRQQGHPYREADTPHPLGVYGASKAAGEQALRISGCDHLILRTSWVYSQHGRNFLLTMQRLLQEREELSVVDDQIGAPTWAGSIASATTELIDKWQQGRHHWGTYHLTCQGETSWFGFASAIAERLRAAGKPCARLRPIPSSEYPTPAQRPLNSRLDGERLEQDWQVRLPDWRTALDACLQRMN